MAMLCPLLLVNESQLLHMLSLKKDQELSRSMVKPSLIIFVEFKTGELCVFVDFVKFMNTVES